VTDLVWQLATVDIDGTLTIGHGWRPIAIEFAELPAYERTNARFFGREIGEDEHLTDLLALAAGHTIEEVVRVVDRTPRLTGISEGIRSLRAHGIRVALLTHNPPYVLDRYRELFGFDDGDGVDAQVITGGRIGPPLGVRADKASGLRRLLARAGTTAHRTVHVGDSWSDAEIFAKVGAGIALNSSQPEVRAAADVVLDTTDFRPVAETILHLRPRGEHRSA
jgi:phosphoserine phosphatase